MANVSFFFKRERQNTPSLKNHFAVKIGSSLHDTWTALQNFVGIDLHGSEKKTTINRFPQF